MSLSKRDAMKGLLGTWSFRKKIVASHYYELEMFLVAHFMPDPLGAIGCSKSGCYEIDNKICQEDICIDTESNVVEWSDGA